MVRVPTIFLYFVTRAHAAHLLISDKFYTARRIGHHCAHTIPLLTQTANSYFFSDYLVFYVSHAFPGSRNPLYLHYLPIYCRDRDKLKFKCIGVKRRSREICRVIETLMLTYDSFLRTWDIIFNAENFLRFCENHWTRWHFDKNLNEPS